MPEEVSLFDLMKRAQEAQPDDLRPEPEQVAASPEELDFAREEGLRAARERSLRDPAEPRQGGARITDPDTSHKASLEDLPRKGGQRWVALLAHSNNRGGLTDEELSAMTGVRLNSISTRRAELVRDGWLEDSGRRRETETGAEAVVWVLTLAALTIDSDYLTPE